MPLYLAEDNQDVLIVRITGDDKVKSRLETMGFVVGENIRIINRMDDNVIVKIKGVTIALSHELAKRIYV